MILSFVYWSHVRFPICLAPVGVSLYQLLVVQAFRPDRVLTMVHKVVETVFGQEFMRASEQELDLALIIEKQVMYNTINSHVPDNVMWLQLPEYFVSTLHLLTLGCWQKRSGSCGHITASNVIVQMVYWVGYSYCVVCM